MNNNDYQTHWKLLFLSGFIALIMWTFFSRPPIVSASMGFSLYYVLNYIYFLGKKVQILEIGILFMIFYYLVSPYFVYYHFNNELAFGAMHNPPEVYFLYALGCILAFLIGTKLNAKKRTFDNSLFLKILEDKQFNKKIGIQFVTIGILAFYLNPIVPTALRNFFYIAASLRFIGIFYLLFSNLNRKYLIIFLVSLDFILRIIGGGVFFEFLIWGVFFLIFYFSINPVSYKRKLFIFAMGWLFLFTLQVVKTEYRKVVWNNKAAIERSAAGEFLSITSEKLSEEDLLTQGNFEHFISRLNLGWVVSRTMDHVSTYNLYTGGATLAQDIPSILLPRIIYPQKRIISGSDLRERFEHFTGRTLQPGTTINLSALGDAYINFGQLGGWIALFILGWLFSSLLVIFRKACDFYHPSILLWVPLIYFNLIRMNDFYVLLNTFVKNSIFVLILFYFLRNKLLMHNKYISQQN